jgi:hypothetical protein
MTYLYKWRTPWEVKIRRHLLLGGIELCNLGGRCVLLRRDRETASAAVPVRATLGEARRCRTPSGGPRCITQPRKSIWQARPESTKTWSRFIIRTARAGHAGSYGTGRLLAAKAFQPTGTCSAREMRVRHRQPARIYELNSLRSCIMLQPS